MPRLRKRDASAADRSSTPRKRSELGAREGSNVVRPNLEDVRALVTRGFVLPELTRIAPAYKKRRYTNTDELF